MVTIDMYPNGYVLSGMFSSLGRAMTDYTEAFQDAVSRAFVPAMVRNFDNEAGPDGPWDQLADATVATKGRYGMAAGILQRTMFLYGSVQASGESSWDISKNNASFTAAGIPEYGGFSDSGTVSMPARVWAWLDDQALDETEQVFGEWIDQMIDEHLPFAAFGL